MAAVRLWVILAVRLGGIRIPLGTKALDVQDIQVQLVSDLPGLLGSHHRRGSRGTHRNLDGSRLFILPGRLPLHCQDPAS